MFGKLIKHEFRTMLRVLLPTLLSVLGLGLLTRGTMLLMNEYDSVAINVFGIMLIVSLIFGCIAAFILVMVFLIVRFVRSTLSKEAYLIHTLPVGVHSILCSRLVVAVICMLLTGLSVLASLFIAFFRSEMVQGIQETLRFMQIDSGMITQTLLRTILSYTVSTISTILMFYAAFSVGFSFANSKGGLSVAFIFAFYFGTQIISTVVAVFWFGSVIVNSGSELSIVNDSMIITLCQSVFYGAVFYVISWLMQKKRLNLG